jgi:hypothetical protein
MLRLGRPENHTHALAYPHVRPRARDTRTYPPAHISIGNGMSHAVPPVTGCPNRARTRARTYALVTRTIQPRPVPDITLIAPVLLTSRDAWVRR